MASKKEIKDKTLSQLRELLNIHGTRKDVEESEKYISLYTHFFNKFERENIDIIFDMIEKDCTDTEIREAIKEAIYKKKDPVAEETENIFIFNEKVNVNKDEVKKETKSEKTDNVYSIFIKTEDMAEKEDDEEILESKSTTEVTSKIIDEPNVEESEVKETVKEKTEINDKETKEEEVFSVFGINEKETEKSDVKENKASDETTDKSECSVKQNMKEKAKSLFKKIPTPKMPVYKKKEKPEPITLTFDEKEENPSILNVFKHEEVFTNLLTDLNAEIDKILSEGSKTEEVKKAV